MRRTPEASAAKAAIERAHASLREDKSFGTRIRGGEPTAAELRHAARVAAALRRILA